MRVRSTQDIAAMFGLVCISLLLFLFVASSNVIVEDPLTDSHLEQFREQGVTSGFLGQILVGLNAETSEEAGVFRDRVVESRLINSDVTGWITIPDFNISYPVLYSTNNKAYLRHNINKDYDIAGCIYLDANYGNIYSPMKLIHGHNMKDGTMFGNLPQMLHWDSLDDAPLIQYYDDLGLKTFKIFSVYSVNADEESVIISEYSSLSELENLKKYYRERSWPSISDVPSGLEMLMLNTCWYGESGKERRLHCIVVACRV